jgi:hypothetical protein
MVQKEEKINMCLDQGKGQDMSKSCYLLELSVAPGGARRGHFFAYNKLEHLYDLLRQEFQTEEILYRGCAASLAVWYGQTMVIWVFEEGKLVSAVDLAPFVHVTALGRRFRLSEAGQVSRELDEPDDWEAFDDEAIGFDFDWEGISREAPPLRGTPLQPGETMPVSIDAAITAPFFTYLVDDPESEVPYGFYDAEEGIGGELPELWTDPDPA